MSKKIKKDLIAILLDAIKKGWKPQTAIDTVDSLWPDGHDVKQITYNIVDNSITIINNDNSQTIIYLTEVISGDGMDFVTNTPVTLGTPSTVDSTTINEVTETSHTHELGNINVNKIVSESINYGALYNLAAVNDIRNIANGDFGIPSYADFLDLHTITGSNGGKLKETGLVHWNSPNAGATNEFNFFAVGGGYRSKTGVFTGINVSGNIYLSGGSLEGNNCRIVLLSAYDYLSNDDTSDASFENVGASIRLIRDASVAELLLDDGIYCDPYIGNNGISYRTIKLGAKVWLAENLAETQYENGDWITGFDNGVYTPISSAAWAALTTEAMCFYGDNRENAISQTPVPATDEKVKFDAADPTAGYLSEKIMAGTNITIEEGTGADENKLKISSTGGGGSTTYKALTDTFDDSFTGKDINVPVVDETNDELVLHETEIATFFSLFDFDETTYTGKDGFILEVNESLGKVKLVAKQTIPVKATAAELTAGTDDAKFATAKGLKDALFARIHVGTSPPSDTTMLWLDTN